MRHFVLCAFVSVVCLANASLPCSAAVEQKASTSQSPPSPEGNPDKTPTSTPAQPAAPTPAQPDSAQSALSILRSNEQFPADYIPCVFTKGELLGLRLQPVAATLTSADDENLKQSLLSEASFQSSISNLTDEQKQIFFEQVTSESFEGLTPSQAVYVVLNLLWRNAQSSEQEKTLIDTAQQDSLQLEETAQAQLRLSIPVEYQQVADDVLNVLDKDLNKFDSKNETDEPKKQDIARKALWKLANNASAALATFHRQVSLEAIQNDNGSGLYNLTQDLEMLKRNASAAAEQVGGKAGGSAKAQKAIAESARQAIATYQRPKDVGCAMSILSWNETRHAFGSLLAREYIAVQIVVRNLNDKEDFVLHDAELSVDSDINGGYSRFYSGRDKVIVRGLATAQQNTNKRNLIVHSAEAVGTLMSAVIPVASGMFADAAGVYNGGFLPGLRSTWPDLSVTQLNLLNDVGFSSSTNYKTVVPKSGSVMFVIFVPSKQYENGWWTQKCVEGIAIDNSSESSQSNESPAAKSKLGIDLKTARSQCFNYLKKHPSDEGPQPAESQQAPASSTVNASSTPGNNQLILRVEPVHYKSWSPSALAIFRELAFAVVAGTHIEEESQKQPTLSLLTCPTDKTGTGKLLISPTDTTISCDATGQNLDKVALLRLRNLDDQTDPQTAEGTMSVSGDPTKGKVAFPAAKLASLEKPAYKVYLVTASSVETSTDQVLHLDLTPSVDDSISPKTADPSTSAKMKFTLTGLHMSNIAEIQLFEGSAQTPVKTYKPDPGSNATQMSFTINASDDDFKKKAQQGSGEKLTVAILPSGSGSTPLKTTVTLTLAPAAKTSTPDKNPPSQGKGTNKPSLKKTNPAKSDTGH
jgi:hypothetical protein